MTHEGLETEKKYDVDAEAELPALQDIKGVGRVGEPYEASLEAVYFDTDDLALASRGITLRRRTGGADAGWHLKMAAGPEQNQHPGSAARFTRRSARPPSCLKNYWLICTFTSAAPSWRRPHG